MKTLFWTLYIVEQSILQTGRRIDDFFKIWCLVAPGGLEI